MFDLSISVGEFIIRAAVVYLVLFLLLNSSAKNTSAN